MLQEEEVMAGERAWVDGGCNCTTLPAPKCLAYQPTPTMARRFLDRRPPPAACRPLPSPAAAVLPVCGAAVRRRGAACRGSPAQPTRAPTTLTSHLSPPVSHNTDAPAAVLGRMEHSRSTLPYLVPARCSIGPV